MSKLKPEEKKLVKLGIALVVTVVLGVVLIVATLMGNSSEYEYDSETIQGEVKLDQERQDGFAEKRQQIAKRNSDANTTGVNIEDEFTGITDLVMSSSVLEMLKVAPLLIVIMAVAGLIAAVVKGLKGYR